MVAGSRVDVGDAMSDRASNAVVAILCGAAWFLVGMALGAGFGLPVLGSGFAVGVVVAIAVRMGLDKIT